MVRIRLLEDKLGQGVVDGEIKTPCHLYVGQEAIAAGICACLKKTDYIFGTHRSHGHFLAKGGDMKALMAEVYGKTTGCSLGHGGSMHIIQTNVGIMGAQPLVAGTIPIAVGSALASKIRKEKRITVAFFGDGAVEEGTFYESINFASLKKLPLILVCENNLYSSHLHLRERRALNNIYKTGGLYGVPDIRVDGNDVLAVYETMKIAARRARTGKGITFIEATTYRLRGHVGMIDSVKDQEVTDIRDPKEIEWWQKREPIVRLERYLIGKYIFSPEDLEEIKRQSQREVEAAYLFAQKSLYPDPADCQRFVFENAQPMKKS